MFEGVLQGLCGVKILQLLCKNVCWLHAFMRHMSFNNINDCRATLKMDMWLLFAITVWSY